MSNCVELLREGRLDDALSALQQHVRKQPADVKLRIFLFQLLAVQGQWQRALNQINVIADMDESALVLVRTYQEAIRCETLRSEVFEGKRTPMLFGEPDPWLALLLEAQRLIADGQHYLQAAELRDRAFEDAPATPCRVDGQEVAWLADADSRFGPVFEVVINGRYYWVPLKNIARIHIEAPNDLRDMVWLPAQFTWSNGGDAVGFIPTRYPGSEHSEDATIRLARSTQWVEHEGETWLGLGQRMLTSDVDDHSLLDVRLIEVTENVEALAKAETQMPDDGDSGES